MKIKKGKKVIVMIADQEFLSFIAWRNLDDVRLRIEV